MPARTDAVTQHINGKKFQRLSKEWVKPDPKIEENR